MKKEEIKSRLLEALSRRVGAEKAVGMAELFEEVYRRPVRHRINDTRKLRRAITALRMDGAPIASRSDSLKGGYFLAAAGSELEDYLGRLHRRGLAALTQEARIRNIPLADLLARVRTDSEGESRAAAR
jgi:predicted HD phosphohydrolase